MRNDYLKHIEISSKNKKIIWNIPFFLHDFDIQYSLTKDIKIVEQGITNNFFYFKVKSNEFVVYYKHRKALSFAWENKDMNWLQPKEFRGRFQFSSFSNHLFWKWADCKCKIKIYFLMNENALVIRMGAIRKKNTPFYINRYFDNTVFVPHKKLKNFLIKDKEVVIHSDSKQDQWLLILPLDIFFEEPYFQKEKTYWNMQCCRTKKMFEKYFLAVNDSQFMRQFLLFFYRQYQKSKELSSPFPEFPFLNENRGELRLDTLKKTTYQRCYFRFLYWGKFEVSGYYEKNQIQFCSIQSKGEKKIKIFFPFRKKRKLQIYNNTTQKTDNQGETNQNVSLELEKKFQYTIFFSK